MKISRFSSGQDNAPEQVDVTWGEMVAMLSSSAAVREWGSETELRAIKVRELAAWSPVEYADGATRGQAGVVSTCALVLDMDDRSSPLGDALESLEGKTYVLHSTIKYHPKSNPHRFRVVLPLARPFVGSAQEWRGRYLSAAKALVGEFDESCADQAKLFFLPAHRTSVAPVFFSSDGQLLDIYDYAPKMVAEQEKILDSPPPSHLPPHVEGNPEDIEVIRLRLLHSRSGRKNSQVIKRLVQGQAICARLGEVARNTTFTSLFASLGRMNLRCSDSALFELIRDGVRATALLEEETADDHFETYRAMFFRIVPQYREKTRESDRKDAITAAIFNGKELVEGAAPSPARYVFVHPWGSYVRWDEDRYELIPLSRENVLTVVTKELLATTEADTEMERVAKASAGARVMLADCPVALQLGFDPHAPPFADYTLNTFVPSLVEPVPGECPRIDAICRVLAGGDEESMQYNQDWFAAKKQDPARRMGTALVFIDPIQGAGKTTLMTIFQKILSGAQDNTIGQDQISEQFNEWATKPFVVINEASGGTKYDERMRVMNRIKRLVTDPTISLRAMNKAPIPIENHLALVYTTNDTEFPVTLNGPSDRRFSIFKSAPFGNAHKCYVAELWDTSGGLSTVGEQEAAAWAYKLQHRVVDESRLVEAFSNEARAELLESQKSFFDVWVEEVATDPEALHAEIAEARLTVDTRLLRPNSSRRMISCAALLAVCNAAAERNGEYKVSGKRLGRAIKKHGVRVIRQSTPGRPKAYEFRFDIWPNEVVQRPN